MFQSEISDSSSVCRKGIVADVTFHDTSNFVFTVSRSAADQFPFRLIEKQNELAQRKRELIEKSLKDGTPLPAPEYRSDWMVPVIIFSLFLYAIVRTFPGSFFRNMLRFLMLRGINESSSRDTGALYQWQATLLNLASFIMISLFGYLMLRHYNIEIPDAGNYVTWLICFIIVAAAVTARHFICIVMGNISGQQEIFREYIIGIYNIYRASGIVFSLLSLLILYTDFLAPEVYFAVSVFIASALYLLRVLRLLLIFISRHVSIFYWILYLCALEILPVVIIMKYITGLV